MKYIFLFISIALMSDLFSQTGSLSFDGVDDYVEVENSVFNTIDTGSFTIEVLINSNGSNQSHNPIIFSNSSSVNNGVTIFLRNNSNFNDLAINIGGEDYYVESNINFSNYYCHQLVITRENKILNFFVNGSLKGTKEILGLEPSVASSNKIYIGKSAVNSSYYSGLIGSLRIWNKALVIKEIKEIYSENSDATTPNLIGYYNFKNKVSQTIFDITGNGDGQLGSSVLIDQSDPEWIAFGSAPRVNLGNDTTLLISDFTTYIINPDNAVLVWSDGFSSTLFESTKYYDEPGIYWVKAINNCGITTDTIEIKVKPFIYIPNAFSPDGNSFNKEFRPFFSGPIDNFKFTILSRDRQVVFESQDPNGAWDGNFNGTYAPNGVYVWLLQFTNEKGEIKEAQGTVNLLR